MAPRNGAAHLARGGSESARSHRLWGLVAAKEAARRIWQSEGHAPVYPADLAIVAAEHGRPMLINLDDPGDRTLPAIAIAEADGVAVAIAARDPLARPGIAVERIAESPEGGMTAAETPDERAILAPWNGPLRLEWAARIRSARAAAAMALGVGQACAGVEGQIVALDIVALDEESGSILIQTGPASPHALSVATARRGEYAWAWTLAGASQHE